MFIDASGRQMPFSFTGGKLLLAYEIIANVQLSTSVWYYAANRKAFLNRAKAGEQPFDRILCDACFCKQTENKKEFP